MFNSMIYLSVLSMFVLFGADNGRITGSVVIPDDARPELDSATRTLFQSPVKVRLLNPLNQDVIKETNPDSELNFTFEDVRPGNYFISFAKYRLMEHVVLVSIEDGINIDIGKQYLLPERKCEGPFTPCKDDGHVQYFGSAGNPPEWNPDSVDAHIRSFDGTPLMNVCEYMKIRSMEPIDYPVRRAWVVGTLVETDQGSWLQQPCADSLKSGDFTWPNAITLVEDKRAQERHKIWLETASKVGLSNLIPQIPQNVCEDDLWNEKGPCVAVYGRLETRDNLVATTCDSGKLCAYGYGPISAPAQLILDHIHYPDRP